MTRHHKLIGIALVAFVMGGGTGLAVQATSSPVSAAHAKLAGALKVAEALELADGSRHRCTDLAQGTFEWRWANVPFASSCDARPDVN